MEFNSEVAYYIAMFVWFVWVLSMIDAVRDMHLEYKDGLNVFIAISISLIYIFLVIGMKIEEINHKSKRFNYWHWAYNNQKLSSVFELFVIFAITLMGVGYFVWQQ